MRLARFHPDALSPARLQVFRQFAALDDPQDPAPFPVVAADGTLNGPFNAMLLTPSVGAAMQGLGAAIRHETELTDRMRELAILAVAAHERAGYVQYAHELVGRELGLTEPELESVRDGRIPPLADRLELRVCRVVDLLLRDGDLIGSAYDDTVASVGEALLFELTTIVGYYRLLALQLRVFGVSTPS